MLFAFSVTPKKFLHDLVAKHKDSPGRFSHDTQTRLQRASYNCHIEDLVVESPFMEGSAPVVQDAPPVFRPSHVELAVRWHSTRILFASLRGPPRV